MNPPDILAFITGAGGGIVTMWLWNRSQSKTIEALETERQKVVDQVIEALVLNKTFLEAHQGELSELGVTVKDELTKTRDTLKELIKGAKEAKE